MLINHSLKLTLLTGLLLAGCHDANVPAMQATQLGGQTVSADRLERGRVVYVQYCRACHGDSGKGDGPASVGLRPPPRDLTRGVFKFGGTLPRDGAPTLPRDEDLTRIIRGGLHGSAMLGWDVPDPALQDLIQYLKTLSPRWQQEGPGEPLVPSVDPFATRDAEGVELGRALYHGLAQCSACHPAYASKADINRMVQKLQPGAPPPTFRADLYAPSPTDSIELSLDKEHPLRLMPPDFLHQDLKSVRASSERADLYRVISLGIPGAGMPPWRDTLSEEQIWALAHYVASLQALRGQPGAAALEERISEENAKGR
ncbi:MAG: c-type cytochrome [Deltaproteobacteria bacterium]|nr:c-type cytochrome [Deltaproteobacteria bacterium]